MSLHYSLFIRFGKLGFLDTPPLTNRSLLVNKSSNQAARFGGLQVSGRGSGCWTAPTFPFSGGFPVLTSGGTSFCIGLRSFKCFSFLFTTRSTAPRSQPSLLSISSVTSPSLQFCRGRFSSCIKTTSPVLIFLSWSP